MKTASWALVVVFTYCVSCQNVYAVMTGNTKILYKSEVQENTAFGTVATRTIDKISSETLGAVLRNNFKSVKFKSSFDLCVESYVTSKKGRKEAEKLCSRGVIEKDFTDYTIYALIDFDKYKNSSDIKKLYSECTIQYDVRYYSKNDTVRFLDSYTEKHFKCVYKANAESDFNSLGLIGRSGFNLVRKTPEMNPYHAGKLFSYYYFSENVPSSLIPKNEFFILVTEESNESIEAKSAKLKKVLPLTSQYFCDACPYQCVTGDYGRKVVNRVCNGKCVPYEEYLVNKNIVIEGDNQKEYIPTSFGIAVKTKCEDD